MPIPELRLPSSLGSHSLRGSDPDRRFSQLFNVMELTELGGWRHVTGEAFKVSQHQPDFEALSPPGNRPSSARGRSPGAASTGTLGASRLSRRPWGLG